MFYFVKYARTSLSQWWWCRSCSGGGGNIGLIVQSRFHSHGYENRKQRRQEAAVNATVKTQLVMKRSLGGGEGEKKREKTGHVNHEPGSEFFKMILSRSKFLEM